MFSREEQKRNEELLAAHMENFIKVWKPDEAYRACDFQRELYALIFYAQRVAQEPLVKHMALALSCVPPGPIIVSKDDLGKLKL